MANLIYADTRVSLHYGENDEAYKKCTSCNSTKLSNIGISEYEGLTTALFSCDACGIIYLNEYGGIVGLQFGLIDLTPTKSPCVTLGECSTEHCYICNTEVNVAISIEQTDDDGQYVATLSFSCECNEGETNHVEMLS